MTRRGNIQDTEYTEKSEISHTNAIIQEQREDHHCSQGRDQHVWSHTLAELASRDWSAYPVHLTEPRSRLVGKTGIGALEDVGISLGTVAQSWR